MADRLDSHGRQTLGGVTCPPFLSLKRLEDMPLHVTHLGKNNRGEDYRGCEGTGLRREMPGDLTTYLDFSSHALAHRFSWGDTNIQPTGRLIEFPHKRLTSKAVSSGSTCLKGLSTLAASFSGRSVGKPEGIQKKHLPTHPLRC